MLRAHIDEVSMGLVQVKDRSRTVRSGIQSRGSLPADYEKLMAHQFVDLRTTIIQF
jgi:hypothetical protein